MPEPGWELSHWRKRKYISFSDAHTVMMAAWCPYLAKAQCMMDNVVCRSDPSTCSYAHIVWTYFTSLIWIIFPKLKSVSDSDNFSLMCISIYKAYNCNELVAIAMAIRTNWWRKKTEKKDCCCEDKAVPKIYYQWS